MIKLPILTTSLIHFFKKESCFYVNYETSFIMTSFKQRCKLHCFISSLPGFSLLTLPDCATRWQFPPVDSSQFVWGCCYFPSPGNSRGDFDPAAGNQRRPQAAHCEVLHREKRQARGGLPGKHVWTLLRHRQLPGQSHAGQRLQVPEPLRALVPSQGERGSVIGPFVSHEVFEWQFAPSGRGTEIGLENLRAATVGTMTPRKYVLTSRPLVSVRRHGHVASVKIEKTFPLECKLRFPCAQFKLRQMRWTLLVYVIAIMCNHFLGQALWQRIIYYELLLDARGYCECRIEFLC